MTRFHKMFSMVLLLSDLIKAKDVSAGKRTKQTKWPKIRKAKSRVRGQKHMGNIRNYGYC